MSNSSLLSIVNELHEYAPRVDNNDIEKLVDLITSSKRIFIAGAGRSGFMVRAFVNRLMHLGFTAFFVGEPTTPSIQKGDLLIIGSGSGETGSLVTMAKKASDKQANIALLTIYPDSTIAKLSKVVVLLPGATPKGSPEMAVKTIQPMGSLFEQLLLLACESVILTIKTNNNISDEEMFARHANLE